MEGGLQITSLGWGGGAWGGRGAGQEHAEVMRFKAIKGERKRGVLPLSYPSRHEKRR